MQKNPAIAFLSNMIAG